MMSEEARCNQSITLILLFHVGKFWFTSLFFPDGIACELVPSEKFQFIINRDGDAQTRTRLEPVYSYSKSALLGAGQGSGFFWVIAIPSVRVCGDGTYFGHFGQVCAFFSLSPSPLRLFSLFFSPINFF